MPNPSVEINIVPWAFMSKAEFENNKISLMPQLKEHFKILIQKFDQQRAEDYLKYLTAHCGYWLEWGEFFSNDENTSEL